MRYFEKVSEFKYLGALVTENHEVEREVKYSLIQEMPASIQFRDSYHPGFSLETLNLEHIKP